MSILVKQIVFLVLVFSFSYDAYAQVAKNIIVEHFTNTWCPLCTNRNSGFYENLNKQPSILHISYHPSRPYAGCELHQHNPLENNRRTQYYDVYNGTPRLVIQGKVVLSPDYSDAAIFEPHLAQTSPVSIAVEQSIREDGLININILITNEANHTLAGIKLFGGVAEQLVEFDARNGEKEHFDVFRKAYTDMEGELIRLNKEQGDITELNYQVDIKQSWALEEFFSFVILQEEDTKAVIQAAISKAGEFTIPVSIAEVEKKSLPIFPNPVEGMLNIALPNQEFGQLKIYDCSGKLKMHSALTGNEKVDLSILNKGLYFVEVEQKGKFFQHKIVKQ